MEDLIGKAVGQYQVQGLLGRGGMAAVYRAYQPSLDREVALKVLSGALATPEFMERFQQEAKAIAKLNHPNILAVYDCGTAPVEGSPVHYIAMQYVEGGTLKDKMGLPMDLETAGRIVSQVAEALACAHRHRIVHRDVKPSNILLAEGGRALLSDFGIAKVLDASEGLTRAGVGLGTPQYMSPEQAQGLPVDHRSDIYSLGIVLDEMLTGQPPFQGDTPLAVITQQITQPLPSPREINPAIPETVERVIRKATAKAPANRYQTMDAMVKDLRRAMPGAVAPARAPSALKWLAVATPGLAGLACACLAVALLAGFLMFRGLPGRTGTIQGTVIDKNTARAVAGTKVTVGGKEGQSDAQGRFKVPGLAAGQYVLVSTKEGYDPAMSALLSLEAGASLNADVVLYPRGTTPRPVDPATTHKVEAGGAATANDARRLAQVQGVSQAVDKVTETKAQGNYVVNYKLDGRLASTVATLNHEAWLLTTQGGLNYTVLKSGGNLAVPLSPKLGLPGYLGVEQFPAAIGTELTYYVTQNATISFDFQGPWDFSRYTSANTGEHAILAASAAPGAERFPQADSALRMTQSQYPDLTVYFFRKQTPSSLFYYGYYSKQAGVVTHSQPVREYIFPLAIGATWTDEYTYTPVAAPVAQAFRVDVKHTHTVVGWGPISLPAGRFESSVMIQNKMDTRPSMGQGGHTWTYYWLVPRLGYVAGIMSKLNEPQELFTTGTYVWALKSYKVAGK